MNTSHKFRKQVSRYTKEINKNNAIIPTLPQETFGISRSGESLRYRVIIGIDSKGQPIYRDINKKNMLLASNYVYRMYLEQLNCDLQQEVDAMNAYLSKHKDVEPGHMNYTHQDEFNKLLRFKIGTTNEELQKGLNAKYKMASFRKDECIVLTLRGERVRSKSEAIIADELFKRGIPYVYEPTVEINGIEYMPDFILADPETGTLYMWEHLGLMDKNDYACRAFDKFKQYQLEGWTLGINLITTSEIREFPFTGQNASAAIDYFL